MMPATDAYDSALDQLQRYGLLVDHLDTSGTLQRVPHRDDKPGKKDGWYAAVEVCTRAGKTLVVGQYGWWRDPTCDERNWKELKVDASGVSIDEQREIEARRRDLKQRAMEAKRAKQAEAAARAAKIWPALSQHGLSPYLTRKRVQGYGLKFAQQGTVVVPLRTGLTDADLVGLQFIQADGAKRFLTGTAKQGAWHALGQWPGPGGVLAIGEGYATVATVQALRPEWCGICAFDAGNLRDVAKAVVRLCPGARVVLLADDDHRSKGNPGVTKATAAARAVRGVVAVPRFASTAPDRGGDWNDLLVAEGEEVVRAQLDALELDAPSAPPGPPPGAPPGRQGGQVIEGAFPGGDWRQRLLLTDKGALKPTSFNVRLILTNDPAWRGVLAWCDLSHSIQKIELPPLDHASRGEWEDADDAELRFWLAERYGIEPRGQDLADAVLGASRSKCVHPVRDYLDGLQWDGQPRLFAWLSTYLGAGIDADSDIPSDDQRRYLELVGTLYPIQAVSRVRRPGLKADTVLILEGEQGAGKSTSLRVLFGEDFFSDTPIDIGSKDAYEALRGLWCIELAELDSLNKADATRAKAFFSSPVDRFRLPYGHRSKRFTRQCVVAGTTNQYQHLRDQTGNRRFWSVTVGAMDLDALARDRDQLWAEADHLFRAGHHWWPASDDVWLFSEHQDARLDGDVWEALIQDYLDAQLDRATSKDARARLHVTSAEVMQDALGIDKGSMKRPEQTRVGILMQALGWRSCKPRISGRQVRGYRPGPLAIARAEERATSPATVASPYQGGPF